MLAARWADDIRAQEQSPEPFAMALHRLSVQAGSQASEHQGNTAAARKHPDSHSNE